MSLLQRKLAYLPGENSLLAITNEIESRVFSSPAEIPRIFRSIARGRALSGLHSRLITRSPTEQSAWIESNGQSNIHRHELNSIPPRRVGTRSTILIGNKFDR